MTLGAAFDDVAFVRRGPGVIGAAADRHHWHRQSSDGGVAMAHRRRGRGGFLLATGAAA